MCPKKQHLDKYAVTPELVERCSKMAQGGPNYVYKVERPSKMWSKT